MAKINFTPDHQAKLKALAMVFLFSGLLFKGAINTTLNVFQLIHDTSLNTLRTIYAFLEREIAALNKTTKWDMNDTQQRKLAKLQEQLEFIDLLIGYRLYQEQLKENRKLIAEKRQQLLELEDSILKPEDRINALRAELSLLNQEEIKEEAPVVTIPFSNLDETVVAPVTAVS